MGKLEDLRVFGAFAGVPAETLSPLRNYFIYRSIKRGETLWQEGQPALKFAFLICGVVKIVKCRADGGQTILGVFGPGEPIGHVAVLRQIDFPATAMALNDVQVLEVYHDHIVGLLKDLPTLREAMMQAALGSAHHLVGRLHDLSVSDAEQRLALLFSYLLERFGSAPGEEPRINLYLTRSDIAELINVRVETAIRLLSVWQKEGLVTSDSDGFVILNPSELEARAIS